MKIITHISLLFMLLAVFIITNVDCVNAGTVAKESNGLVKASQPLVVKTKNTTKPFSQKNKLKHTLQRNNSTIFKQGNRTFLKFSTKVVKLTLFDHNSKRIGYFSGGHIFDITEIIKKVKGEKLKMQYHISNPSNTGAKVSKITPSDSMNKIIKYARIPHSLMQSILPRFERARPGDDNEPANNRISGAASVSAANILGSVGGDDTYDYLSYTTPRGGFGCYVEVSRVSGNIRLYSLDARQVHLTNDRNKLWISLAPGTIFYIGIEPLSTYDETEYEINIEIQPIPDALEPNDLLIEAKPWDVAGTRFLCNAIPSAGSGPYDLQGLWDTYQIDGHGGETMHVALTNAGLPGSTSVVAAVIDSSGIALDHFTGNSNGISFTYLKGSESTWYIMFYENYSNSSISGHYDGLTPYGTGTGPECFSGSGYTLNITFE
jgi:hypothetical protein